MSDTPSATFREKILKFMNFNDEVFHLTIKGIIDPMQQQFVDGLKVDGPENLPADYKETLTTIDNALRAERAKLEEMLVELFSKTNITEADFDTFVAWQQGGLSKRLGEMVGTINEEMEKVFATFTEETTKEEAIKLYREKRDEIYKATLSEEDFKMLTDFMGSEVGQKFAEADLGMMEGVIEVNSAWLNAALDPIRPILQNLLGVEAPAPAEARQAAEWVPPVETPPSAA